MSNTIQSKIQKKMRMPIPIEGLINVLHNIKPKIDAAAGAATELELRLRALSLSLTAK